MSLTVSVEYVGEDGRGTHRLPLGSDCLLLADIVVYRMLVDQTTPTTHNNKTHSNKTHSHTSHSAHDKGDHQQGISTRGSNYFVHALRLHRFFQQEDAAINDKGKERVQTALAVALLNMLPSPSSASTAASTTTTVVKGGSGGGGENGLKNKGLQVTVVVPDVASWQRLQLLLDTDISSSLQCYLSTSDALLKTHLFRVCTRALTACVQVPNEVSQNDPYVAIGRQFSGEGWVHGATAVLRGTLQGRLSSLGSLAHTPCSHILSHTPLS